MDSMAVQILQLIVSNTSISLQQLEGETNASRGQVEYRIKKINEFLRIQGNKIIQKKGQFFSTDLDSQNLTLLLEELSPLFYLTDKERQHFILVMLLFNDTGSLTVLSEKLAVSKNTILADNKKLIQQLKKQQVDLVYSRKTGYYLKGEELVIRKIGIKAIKEIINDEQEAAHFATVFVKDLQRIKELQTQLELLETHLNLTFTEAKLVDLSFVLYMCTKRIECGNRLQVDALKHVIPMVDDAFYKEVSSTLNYFFKGFDDQQEVQFVSLQILSTSLILNRTQQKDRRLLLAIKQTIQRFEILGITTIDEKEELADALYQHIIPASYRIKFGVPDNNPNAEKIIEEYQHVHQLLKEAIKPIETVLKVTFPQDELTYVTVLFLSFLKNELVKKDRKRAVVVCLQGISISRLLLESLKELFPDIDFVRYMSLREFYEMDDRYIDFVFSTVHLDTEKKVFFIQHFLNEQEKSLLSQEVEQELGNVSKQRFAAIETEKILEIIDQYASITEKQLLEKKLGSYFNSLKCNQTNTLPRNTGDHQLLRLLPIEHIQIYQETLTFPQAIEVAAKPLVEGRFVETSYAKKIINNYDPAYPYFVIAPETAIPHAGPDDGVNKLGMSLLLLKKPVYFSNELPVRLIFMIAPKDKNSHINAVSSLYNFVNDKQHLKRLLSGNYERELKEYLEKHLGCN
ncbi:BglG family transcription antiterminator [Enterococcus termitis]|uniref:Ascorbate-specific PTS system EIIA component n=1 Tax=Enterococcus termitis TaxID=332950 RepID=A0A1E5GYP4_9ENTE|nr:BglG family transcription antiterminator [Enterococcus termitis]OEG17752.1 hypothetical protein BCR25_17925 [Enterococcus termitis]OJG96848.1 hypothetical protein RV18_GL001786 [Enterococcus termitis]